MALGQIPDAPVDLILDAVTGQEIGRKNLHLVVDREVAVTHHHHIRRRRAESTGNFQHGANQQLAHPIGGIIVGEGDRHLDAMQGCGTAEVDELALGEFRVRNHSQIVIEGLEVHRTPVHLHHLAEAVADLHPVAHRDRLLE